MSTPSTRTTCSPVARKSPWKSTRRMRWPACSSPARRHCTTSSSCTAPSPTGRTIGASASPSAISRLTCARRRPCTRAPTKPNSVPDERKKLTVPDLAARKKAGDKVVMASIPDYPSAVWAERAGIDIAAVGDSLGMVSYGFPNTLPVTIDMMIQHAQAVRRGAPNCLIMVSMTYGSYATPEIGVAKAVDDAVKIFTFSIGAGPASCGQLLLAFDLLGVFDQFKPKFTKRYAQISEVAVDALKHYAEEVRSGKFPDAEHSYGMKPEEQEKLARLLQQRGARSR